MSMFLKYFGYLLRGVLILIGLIICLPILYIIALSLIYDSDPAKQWCIDTISSIKQNEDSVSFDVTAEDGIRIINSDPPRSFRGATLDVYPEGRMRCAIPEPGGLFPRTWIYWSDTGEWEMYD